MSADLRPMVLSGTRMPSPSQSESSLPRSTKSQRTVANRYQNAKLSKGRPPSRSRPAFATRDSTALESVDTSSVSIIPRSKRPLSAQRTTSSIIKASQTRQSGFRPRDILSIRPSSTKPKTPNTAAIFGHLSTENVNASLPSAIDAADDVYSDAGTDYSLEAGPRLAAVGLADSQSDTTTGSREQMHDSRTIEASASRLGGSDDSDVSEVDSSGQTPTPEEAPNRQYTSSDTTGQNPGTDENGIDEVLYNKDHNDIDDQHDARDAAAEKIQVWWRQQHARRLEANTSALQSLLKARRSSSSTSVRSSLRSSRPRLSRYRRQQSPHDDTQASSTHSQSSGGSRSHARPSLLDDDRLKAFKLAAQQRALRMPQSDVIKPNDANDSDAKAKAQTDRQTNTADEGLHQTDADQAVQEHRSQSEQAEPEPAASEASHSSLHSLMQLLEQASETQAPENAREPGQAAASVSAADGTSSLSSIGAVSVRTINATLQEALEDPIENPNLQEDLKQQAQAADSFTSAFVEQRQKLEQQSKLLQQLQSRLDAYENEKSAKQAVVDKPPEMLPDTKRQEYEETIARHLSFIDQLMEEKAKLGEKCQELAGKLTAVSKKAKHRVQATEHRLESELARQKKMILTAESKKRKAWMEEQSKRIKEATVKGLEPEIQRLMAQHEAEMARLKEIQADEMRRHESIRSETQQREIEAVKRELETELRKESQRELQAVKDRYQRQLEEDERQYQQQRRHWQQELDEERRRHQTSMKEEQRLLHEQYESWRAEEKANTDALVASHEKQLDEMRQSHASALTELKSQLAIEKEGWEEVYIRKQKNLITQQEAEMREKLRYERDQEIEKVIARLEAETLASQKTLEAEGNLRLQRAKEKMERQLQEAEDSERASLRRYTTCRQELAEKDAQLGTMRGQLEHAKEKIVGLEAECAQLQSERQRLKDVLRLEFQESIAAGEATIERLNASIRELKAEHRNNLAQQQSMHDQQLSDIHEKIRATIEKKDETIGRLKQDLLTAQTRADHLNGLIQKQQEQLLEDINV
eukprot:TRINITY_DN11130_c0_g1_i1.p1 TRINITY_DN11130_c0_g1~~TRINITY_DN11130_c0_g1_i1.p1  ORF type:complete len:1042 (+),score=200.21 TRINITY_DN11130_c0_g1_i1:1345-4470(+)